MSWFDHLSRFWPHFAAGFDLLAALLASTHALLNKRDSRSATIWIGLVWLMPILGATLYLIFGVNRIRRRAIQLGVHKDFSRTVPENLGETEHDGAEHLKHIARVVSRVVKQPLTAGNQIEPLVNGDEAFPAMLAAITAAQKSVTLCSYIFDNDATGQKFVVALAAAVKRGVAVRVLVDAAGTRYSWPAITRPLRAAQIPFAKFLPTSLLTPWKVATINLRNHRKLLVVDGLTAFTGGMNLRHGNVLAAKPAHPVQDLHFKVTGAVVTELQEVFANDWAFTTGEDLAGETWFPDSETRFLQANPNANDGVIARAVPDGPDGDFENARWAILAALAEAQTSVQILTPYFLPDAALICALNLAALRGVRVDIVLPAHGNLPYVQWASQALWWQVLERGCKIWLTPPPFDHSKLMAVDGHWVFLGSANWDARSLRLNFELNVECYSREFGAAMQSFVDRKISSAREVSLAEIDSRPWPVKLRDAAAKLFSPFL
jgi:cardiolipin synthase A/B